MADDKEKPSVAKRVVSTAAKAVGKGLEKIPEFNEYLDKKYGENVLEGKVSDSVRKTLFGDNPKKSTEYAKKTTEAMGKDSYFKKGGKVKKYADGGMTQQPTYPFYGNTPQAGGQNGGMNQTFNMQPQATADNGQMQQPKMFKKGGKVSSASKRADGCCVRGKTRA
jgi:hypothetical protein